MNKYTVIRSWFHLILNKKDWLVLSVFALLQTLLSLLDLFAIFCLGAVTALAANSLNPNQESSWFNFLEKVFNLGAIETKTIILIGLSTSAVLFILKTCLGIILNKLIVQYLTSVQKRVSVDFVRKLKSSNFEYVKNLDKDTLSYVLVEGIAILTTGFVSIAIQLIADFSLALLLLVALAIVDLGTTLFSALLFSFGGLVVVVFIGKRIRKASDDYLNILIENRRLIYSYLRAFKELKVFNKIEKSVDHITLNRSALADANGSILWLQSLPKYVIEILLVVNVTVLTLFLTVTRELSESFGLLVLFITSATRMAPAALRIQTSMIEMHRTFPMFERVNLLLDLISNSRNNTVSEKESTESQSFNTQKSKDTDGVEIVINEVSFVFRKSSTLVLEKVSFTIESGSVVALVGNSGSGKTTITEIILGLLKQTNGDIFFDGESSEKWLATSSNRVSYVPQDPSMNWDSIAQNVALEQDFSCINLDSVKKALSYVGFESNFELDESVSNLNIKLSGGQKQRLSIARAIYHESKLLIVDEATSSLDGLSEEVITDYLIANPLKQTIIIIAHRLSSIKKVDNIFVLGEGKIKTSGNYEDLIVNSPEFTQQAKSLGLL